MSGGISKDRVLSLLAATIMVLVGVLQTITINAIMRISDRLEVANETAIRNAEARVHALGVMDGLQREVAELREDFHEHNH